MKSISFRMQQFFKSHFSKKGFIANSFVFISSGTIFTFITNSLFVTIVLAIAVCLIFRFVKLFYEILKIDLKF
jgi:NhaP-type Na+/H+ or K+/H+ antiporter